MTVSSYTGKPAARNLSFKNQAHLIPIIDKAQEIVGTALSSPNLIKEVL